MKMLETPTIPNRMSSREVAELTGKRHADVMRDIRSMQATLTNADLRSCAESATYIGADMRAYEMYEMDKETTMCLMAGYDAVARMKIIQRWQQLENGVVALTPAEILLQQAQQMVVQERRLALIEREQATLVMQVAELEAKQTTIDSAHYSISGYASLHKKKVPTSTANGLGRRAAALSKQQGYPVGQVPDAKYGSVGSYHVDVLQQVFEVPTTAVVRVLPAK